MSQRAWLPKGAVHRVEMQKIPGAWCQLTAHSANQSHPYNVLNLAVSVCVAVQKETEIMYNPPLFCGRSLSEDQLDSQVISQVSLWSGSPGIVWAHGTGELVLSSATSAFAMSERSSHCSWMYGAALVKGHMIPQTHTFFLSVFYSLSS